ncbi:PH domain-containing protein [Ancylomarina sp. DW003]|nr:PH domain-containing protein [Ancylomarina sp. DW003]MDE5423536.1 PH domain-containing protein [Ancylomarina sp. DW003]
MRKNIIFRFELEQAIPTHYTYIKMTTELENNQIWLSDIPKGESIEFTSLLPKYKRLLNIQWTTFFALLIIALIVAYFNFEEIGLVWFGVAFTLWLIFLLIKFSFIQLGFPNKGYAIRQKDLHYKTGYLTHKTISVPFNRIQHVEIRQGFISKMLDLAVLKIYTAGNSAHDLSLKGISLETAEEIKQIITSKVTQDA